MIKYAVVPDTPGLAKYAERQNDGEDMDREEEEKIKKFPAGHVPDTNTSTQEGKWEVEMVKKQP